MAATNRFQLLRHLGPGLLYAGAAVGVSHLVQSTRAGAEFGFALVWAVLLANLLKYPFFEFGPRYAASTGKSLLSGYQRLGNWAVVIFFVLTFSTMFIVQAAITIVTAGLAEQLTGAGMESWQWSLLLLSSCLLLLGIGRYALLDKLMKGIIVVLSLTTIIALIAAISVPIERDLSTATQFSFGESKHIFFLVALIGWMPAPIDIAVWHSVWTIARKEQTGRLATLKEALLDFKIGFWGTTVLALCFVSLGALVMYGTGEELSASGPVFAGQVINLYTSSIGQWAYLVIALAAFTTMFSTTLTCLDAFPRVLQDSTQLLLQPAKESKPAPKSWKKLYWIYIATTAAGALIIIGFFTKNMRWMVDLATTVSFVTAPVLAILNYMAITSDDVPDSAKPGLPLRILSWIGIVFLSGFSLFFLYFRFILH